MMAEMMKRVILKKPFKLEVEEVPKAIAEQGEVLVKVLRCGVCGSDFTIYEGKHPWAISPLIMGHEFAGVIDSVGKGVDSKRVGQRVAILPHRICGNCFGCRQNTSNLCSNLKCMGAEAHGGHAEFVSVPAKMAIPIPASLSFDSAALLEPACVAYHGINRAGNIKGKTVCVIGAGPIGAFAVQSATALGAEKVIVADLKDDRIKLVTQWAYKVFNLTDKPLSETLRYAGIDKEEIDIYVDCVGQEGQVLEEIMLTSRRNTSVIMIGVLRREYNIPHLAELVQHEITIYGTTMYDHKDYLQMIELMANKKICIDGMITHRFNMEDIPNVLKTFSTNNKPFFKIMLDIAEN
jgi:L-iditol 2-dehydrogenase